MNKKLFLPIIVLMVIISSCIKNDFPYPVVKMYITFLSVEGQIGETVISNEKMTATVDLADTVNIKKVHITSLEITEGGNLSFRTDTVVDLSSPFVFNISLYQDYEWAICANQNMNYAFKVKGQFGQTSIYPETNEASLNIPVTQSLYYLDLEELKLGPTGALYNGEEDINNLDLEWKVYKDYAVTKVLVTYKDFFSKEWTLYVHQTDDIVITKSVDAWTKVAWLHGEGVSGVENGFEYKLKGTDNWSKLDQANVTQDGGKFTGKLIHLESNTTYVCRAYSGTKYGEELEFTTENEAQLPNNTFDDWHMNGKTWYIFNSGGEMFWDSGNEGGTTGMAALSPYNMTTQGTDYYHTSPSVKMVSKTTAGILAAGNLFVGDFLGTENTTKGILGWGRSWNLRPVALKGYVRYVPVATSHEKLPDGDDDGIIYIAIGDWAGASYNKNWPVIIRNANPETDLFNTSPGTYTGDGIIAYGEKVFEKETKGADGGMIEFEIPLDYRSLDRIPTSIIIVASSSRYGDYYIGGDGSSMWLDDITLEYDYE